MSGFYTALGLTLAVIGLVGVGLLIYTAWWVCRQWENEERGKRG